MLVMSRKANESLFLVDAKTNQVIAKLTVLRSERRGTRIGVEAEETVLILREELMAEKPGS